MFRNEIWARTLDRPASGDDLRRFTAKGPEVSFQQETCGQRPSPNSRSKETLAGFGPRHDVGEKVALGTSSPLNHKPYFSPRYEPPSPRQAGLLQTSVLGYLCMSLV